MLYLKLSYKETNTLKGHEDVGFFFIGNEEIDYLHLVHWVSFTLDSYVQFLTLLRGIDFSS